MANGGWIQSASGTEICYSDPDPESFKIEDIALALSRTCRFSGHSKCFYSVAQHSVLAAMVAPEKIALHVLLHDAHEAYTGDIPSPLKRMLGDVIHKVEYDVQAAIYTALDLTPPTEKEIQEIREIDMNMLVTENEYLFEPNLWDFPEYKKYKGLLTQCWTMEDAEGSFIALYDMLRHRYDN